MFDKMKNKIIKRKCVVCSKNLNIKLYESRHYKGGHYFGKMEFYNKYRKTGKMSKILGFRAGIIKGVGKPKLVEYWECDKCFRD